MLGVRKAVLGMYSYVCSRLETCWSVVDSAFYLRIGKHLCCSLSIHILFHIHLLTVQTEFQFGTGNIIN